MFEHHLLEESMLSPARHIHRLFETRGKDDSNSTTLAQTLDKDIQTVFNSIEKFVFELLQNADDAGLPDVPVEMSFVVRGNHLVFSHNGKHFDQDDVDAICDNARRRNRGKELDLEKTGYKGIGFKSVFVIADCVYIFSREYTFRFDRYFSKWNEHAEDNPDGCYPWQIIPIWTPPEECAFDTLVQDSKVNFVLEVREGVNLKEALKVILTNPHLILFLRRTALITIDIDGETETIRLENYGETSLLYVNNRLVDRWLILKETFPIPDSIRAQMQEMGAHECPEKLKQAEQTQITFAARVQDNRLVESRDAVLCCYLPTLVKAGLPFLVNADFLLSADRTQLLTNIWNQHLFTAIALLHVDWLKELAYRPEWRDQILVLFTSRLADHLPPIFKTSYSRAIESALKEIPFIPADTNVSHLLYFDTATVDDTGFYRVFPGMELEVEATIVREELEAKNKLKHHLRLTDLARKIEGYAADNKTFLFQERLLAFLMDKYPVLNKRGGYSSYFPARSELYSKKFILTNHNELVEPSKLYLLTCSVEECPSFIQLNFIHPHLSRTFSSEHYDFQDWLKELGTKETTIKELFNEVVRYVQANRSRITADLSFEIVRFLYRFYRSGEITQEMLKQCAFFPLLTQERGGMKSANECYLSSRFYPEMDLQVLVGESEFFVSDQYLDINVDMNSNLTLEQSEIKAKQLGTLFQFMGVKSRFGLSKSSWYREGDSTVIDYYREYREYLRTNDKVDFFGDYSISNFLYAAFLRYLPRLGYAKFFWYAVTQNWDEMIHNFAQPRVSVSYRSNRRSRDQNYAVTPYLVYVLSERACIQATDGQLYRSQDCCSPALIRELGERLSALFPQMRVNFDGFRLTLTDEMADFFKFKTKLSLEDYIRLFQFVEQEEESQALESYPIILNRLSKEEWHADEIDRLRKLDVKLPASDNSLQPANMLCFFQGKTAIQSLNSSRFLKSLELDSDQMQVICSLFQISILDLSDVIVEYSTLEQAEDLKTHLWERLPIWMAIESTHIKQESKKLLIESSMKLQKLEIYEVVDLKVCWRSVEDVFFNQKIFLNGDQLYYVNDGSQASNRVLQSIGSYLGLSLGTLLDMTTTSRLSYSELLLWFSDEKGSNLNCIPSLNDEDIAGYVSATMELDDTEHERERITHPERCNRISSSIFEDEEAADDIVSDSRVQHTAQRLRKGSRGMGERTYEGEGKELMHRKGGMTELFKLRDKERTNWMANRGMREAEVVPGEVDYHAVGFFTYRSTHSFNVQEEEEKLLPSVSLAEERGREEDLREERTEGEGLDAAQSHRKSEQSSQVRCSKKRDINSGAIANWVGRWGEESVFYKLRHHYDIKYPNCILRETTKGFTLTGKDRQASDLSLEVIWHNRHEESGKPIDLEIIRNGKRRFIEVKSTHHSEKNIVRFSRNEWRFMRANDGRYRLFSLYNAGKRDGVSISKIKSPATKILSGELNLHKLQIKL